MDDSRTGSKVAGRAALVAFRPSQFYDPPMGWRAWDAYDTEARARWRALPWRERYGRAGIAIFALIAVVGVLLVWLVTAHAARI